MNKPISLLPHICTHIWWSPDNLALVTRINKDMLTLLSVIVVFTCAGRVATGMNCNAGLTIVRHSPFTMMNWSIIGIYRFWIFNFRKQGRQILLTRRNNNFPSKLLDHIHILGHRQGTYYAHLLLPYIFYLLTQDLDGNEAHETGEVNLLSECQGMVIQLNDNKCHWSCEFMLSIQITIMAHKPVTRCGFHKNTNETVRIWFVGECMDLHW